MDLSQIVSCQSTTSTCEADRSRVLGISSWASRDHWLSSWWRGGVSSGPCLWHGGSRARELNSSRCHGRSIALWRCDTQTMSMHLCDFFQEPHLTSHQRHLLPFPLRPTSPPSRFPSPRTSARSSFRGFLLTHARTNPPQEHRGGDEIHAAIRMFDAPFGCRRRAASARRRRPPDIVRIRDSLRIAGARRRGPPDLGGETGDWCVTVISSK